MVHEPLVLMSPEAMMLAGTCTWQVKLPVGMTIDSSPLLEDVTTSFVNVVSP